MKEAVVNKSNREEWIDTLKGIFIFLVVLGHLIAFWGASETDIFGVVHYFIYAVHMPMFVLISGYLSNTSCDRRKVIKNYIIPYVIFDFLYALYLLVLDGDASHLNILFPYFVFWYILCLGIMRVILSLTKGKWQVVIVTSALTLIAPFIGETPWRFLSLGRVVLLYGIFYTGFVIKNHITVFRKHKLIAIGIGCLCILLEVILLCAGVTGIAWATHDYPNSIAECLIKWVYMYVITVGLFIMSSAVLLDFCGQQNEISEKHSQKYYFARKALIGGGH